MSIRISSQPSHTPESARFEITYVNQAVRDMYQQEINKITLGIQQAAPDVQKVMQHAMSGLYATRIQYNEEALQNAANDERFTLAA